MSEWQLIDNDWHGPAYEHGVTWGDKVPRDGTDVLLFVESSGEQFVAYYDTGSWVYALIPLEKGGGVLCCEPTHWMPLPNPPVSTDTEENR